MANALKILHTADWHLDTPFKGISADKAALRRGEQRDMADKIAYLAYKEDVDLVLLAGDIFDSHKKASPESVSQFLRFLEGVGCPVIISPGNHDYYTPDGVYANLKLPDNVHVFGHNTVQYVDFPELDTRVFGAAFTSDGSNSLIAGRNFAQSTRMADDYFGIMCIHGDYNNPQSKYNPVSPKDVEGCGLDYIALGHNHKSSGLVKNGNTFLYNPGCPEGRGFDETGVKTVAIVEIDKKEGTCKVRKHDVSKRKYEIVEADITGADPLLKIHTLLPDDTTKDIYRIILKGEGTPDVARLYRNLKELFFYLDIRDNSVTPRDIWEHMGDDTLRGVFLTKMKGIIDTAGTEEEKKTAMAAVRWGLAALDNGEEVSCLDY